MAVNCGAIPDGLIESELFGHERGAFTGADRARVGLFEETAGGTLFLDEVGEASPRLQAVLLRILEDGKVRRVGSVRDVPIEVRVVAAANRPLHELLKRGRFREDLFYRLYVHAVRIPPLRARPEDIPVLAAHFLHRIAEREGRRPKRLDPAALPALIRHSWPGNVRELSNLLTRAASLSPGPVVTPESLELIDAIEGRPAAELARSLPYAEAKKLVLREYLAGLLRTHGGNLSRAAAAAQLRPRSLRRLLEQHGVSRDSIRPPAD